MPDPDRTDDTAKKTPTLQTSLPWPSITPNETLPNPLDLKSNFINDKAQTNGPAVHALGLEDDDPRSRDNHNILNLDVTTPGLSDPTTPSVNASKINSPTKPEVFDERGSKASKTKPSPLSDSTGRRPRKLSGAQVVELTSQPLSPNSIPHEVKENTVPELRPAAELEPRLPAVLDQDHESSEDSRERPNLNGIYRKKSFERQGREKDRRTGDSDTQMTTVTNGTRPNLPARTVSTPPLVRRKKSYSRGTENHSRSKGRPFSPPTLNLKDIKSSSHTAGNGQLATPPPEESSTSTSTSTRTVPSLSLSTYLQLELAADPKSTSLTRGSNSEFVYESSAIKLERLRNFLVLPFYLEQLLWFGATACLDAWLYTFTILPLRFLKAFSLLVRWWFGNAGKEAYDLIEFVYLGIGRLWRRRSGREGTPRSEPSSREPSRPRKSSLSNGSAKRTQETNGVIHAWPTTPKPQKRDFNKTHRHRRTRSTPSLLQATHKADLLKGLLVIICSILLMKLDPSRIYHNVRGQSAVKLYVIYNALEVGDKLLSALGQDVLECLFSREVLERNSDGRSKVIRPLWVFMIALVYTVTHAAGLLYQVITLNVAVNSYSNALLTLLVSNQFVEIKGAVFKKIEKQNLFQLTCADVVERFQLWLMLLIIAMRNMVEVGSLNISISSSLDSTATATAEPANIASNSLSLTGQVLGPFLMVLGSEMVVDWIKHAYIDKFNDTKPAIYSRFLDIMAADYYSNAFGDQNLTKRIGLPVLPLACLFIRTTIQTYHMFLATHLPLPLPSPATSLVNTHDPVGSEATASSTPGTVAALAHVDLLFRRALGRTGFPDDEGLSSSSLLGIGTSSIGGWLARLASYTLDEVIALFLLLLICAVVFLVLVAAKLVLGLVLLRWARYRCAGMRERERTGVDVGSRRLGVNGMVEVPDEARRRIYEGDDAGLAKVKEKEDKARRDRERGRGLELGGVSRYAMVAKRIW